MSDVTVRQLAAMLNRPIETLLEQLSQAGMAFNDPDQVITGADKLRLLKHLRSSHGKGDTASAEIPQKITLRRKVIQEITVGQGRGGAKTVNVEVRAKRTYVKRSLVAEQVAQDSEREEAQRRLEESRRRQEAEEQARREAEERRRLEDEQRRLLEEAERQRQEEERRRREEERLREEAEREAARRAAEEAKARLHEQRRREEARRQPVVVREIEDETAGVEGEEESSSRFLRGELHLSKEASARRSKRRAQKKPEPAAAPAQHGFSKPTAPVVREIAIGETIQVGELAQKMAVKAGEVIKALMKLGVMATINQTLDYDTAALVVEEFGHVAKPASERDLEEELIARAGPVGEARPRPPW